MKTDLACKMIRSSANRCFDATGEKCGVVVVSVDLWNSMDAVMRELFDGLVVFDPKLTGYCCYAKKP